MLWKQGRDLLFSSDLERDCAACWNGAHPSVSVMSYVAISHSHNWDWRMILWNWILSLIWWVMTMTDEWDLMEASDQDQIQIRDLLFPILKICAPFSRFLSDHESWSGWRKLEWQEAIHSLHPKNKNRWNMEHWCLLSTIRTEVHQECYTLSLM